jgi:flagellar basal body-associated protein FliL
MRKKLIVLIILVVVAAALVVGLLVFGKTKDEDSSSADGSDDIVYSNTVETPVEPLDEGEATTGEGEGSEEAPEDAPPE